MWRRKLLKEISDILKDYGIVGLVMSLLTILIRPFISVKQVLRDCAITFIFSMLGGLLLEYINIPIAVKFGLSGVCGLFAVHIYIIFEHMFKYIADHPEHIFHHLSRKKHND